MVRVALDWSRIGFELADWSEVGTLVEGRRIGGLVMDWHWDGGLAGYWEIAGLALDWWIFLLVRDWNIGRGLTLDWHWIGVGLVDDWYCGLVNCPVLAWDRIDPTRNRPPTRLVGFPHSGLVPLLVTGLST